MGPLRAAVVLLSIGLGAFLVFNARQSHYSAQGQAFLRAGGTSETAVVLTGAGGRIERGIALLLNGKTNHLFISGVGEGVLIEDLPQARALTPELVQCCVTLDYEAQDTIGNAREAAQWLTQRNAKSAFLVTSHFHMPRAVAELKALMPDVVLVTISVPTAGGRRHQVREFMKYLAALTRLKLSGSP